MLRIQRATQISPLANRESSDEFVCHLSMLTQSLLHVLMNVHSQVVSFCDDTHQMSSDFSP
jgi:hypothetical protein